MNVKNLIEQLNKLPEDMEVTIYHEVYCGGGDEETYSDPVLRLSVDLRTLFLVPDVLHYLDKYTYEISDLE